MIKVEDILSQAYPGVRWNTVVYATQEVEAALIEYSETKDNPRNFFLNKLKYFAESGFDKWIGPDRPIRSEGERIYRIGLDRSLFRMIGFFSDNTRKQFIVVDVFLKRGQRLGKAEREKIARAAKICREGSWEIRGS
ncbi:MAG: hypothetical protein HC898_04195 [Phycisphaerales bacterium]|nr:hypothetical protein [Phycisphaerales bacterium]